MWPGLSDDQRSRRLRLIALAVAVALSAVALVLALVLSAGPQPGAPQPGATTTSGRPAVTAPTNGPETASASSPQRSPTGPVPAVSPSSAAVTPAPTPEPSTGAPPVAPGPTPPAETLPAQPPPPPPPPAGPFPAALLGKDVEVLPGAGAVVALTFDAGANSAALPRILQTLSDSGIHGTFFVTGAWAAAHPAEVAAIVAAGHRVGNHSMTHPYFSRLPDDGIGAEVLGAQQSIQAAGADPRPLFRFPFGDRDTRTIAAVNNLGYVPVRWTVDTLGWKGTSGGITSGQVADRVLAALRPGEIVLMHVGSNPDDGSTLDADALPRIIDRVRQAGYGFVTLDSLLAG
ncbi:polysaccharide deacetylase family protein [Arthrobacter sp. 92]|uniref:polysaccharide deacetylase family protein n=1 Tax=Arthrobacter sp. 92 TaxID=3418175 RepID=UPI003D076400